VFKKHLVDILILKIIKGMNADCKSALAQINKSWRAFNHNGINSNINFLFIGNISFEVFVFCAERHCIKNF